MSEIASRELLIFEVNGFCFSVPLAVVEEVVSSNVITPVPASPPFLLGVSAVRGRVVGVIDAARRFGLPPGLASYFMVCFVRGNLTAVTIDRPVLAGEIWVRPLDSTEEDQLRTKCPVDEKFLTGAFELCEKNDGEEPRATGRLCLTVDPDLFVSAEMASRVGEAA